MCINGIFIFFFFFIIILFLFRQLIGLGFEIHDSYRELSSQEGSAEERHLRKQYVCIDPSSVDMFQYAFCFIGQFAGKETK